MPPRTIDNLGTDASERYAKDQRTDTSYLKDSTTIPARAKIDALNPSFPEELRALLQDQPTHVEWASIEAPPGQRRSDPPLFGPESNATAQIHKVLGMLSQDPTEEILRASLTKIEEIRKEKIDIYCKISQYHKG